MSDKKRDKFNVALLTINIAWAALLPIVAMYMMVYGTGFFPLQLQNYLPVTFVISWIIYFILMLIAHLDFFPRDNREAVKLFGQQLFWVLLAVFRNGLGDVKNMVIDAGINIFTGFVLAGLFIILFGWYIKLWRLKKENPKMVDSYISRRKDMVGAQWRYFVVISFLLIPSVIWAIVMIYYSIVGLDIYQGISVYSLVDLGGLLFAFGGTFFTYYKQLIKLSIYK